MLRKRLRTSGALALAAGLAAAWLARRPSATLHDDAPAPLEDPLAEPSTTDFFEPLSRNLEARWAELPRRERLEPAEFDSLVASGQPFIVTDAGQGQPLINVTCEEYASRWPWASMRAEYFDEKNSGPEWRAFQHPHAPFLPDQLEWRVPLDNPLWWTTPRQPLPRPNEEHHMRCDSPNNACGPNTGLYIWHVKHEQSARKASILRAWQPPYFVNHSELARWASRDTLEFWFSHAGAGALAHADQYCQTTASLQLHGTKRWRLMMMPAVESAEQIVDEEDSGVYATGRWKPEYEVTLRPGEAIVFPPGYMHETYVHPDDNDGSSSAASASSSMTAPGTKAAAAAAAATTTTTCTSSATFQFGTPLAARYLAAHLPRLAVSHLQHKQQCVVGRGNLEGGWAQWATLRPSDELEIDGGGNASATRAAALRTFADVDADADGRLTLAELHWWMRTSPRARWARRSRAGDDDGEDDEEVASPVARLLGGWWPANGAARLAAALGAWAEAWAPSLLAAAAGGGSGGARVAAAAAARAEHALAHAKHALWWQDADGDGSVTLAESVASVERLHASMRRHEEFEDRKRAARRRGGRRQRVERRRRTQPADSRAAAARGVSQTESAEEEVLELPVFRRSDGNGRIGRS